MLTNYQFRVEALSKNVLSFVSGPPSGGLQSCLDTTTALLCRGLGSCSIGPQRLARLPKVDQPEGIAKRWQTQTTFDHNRGPSNTLSCLSYRPSRHVHLWYDEDHFPHRLVVFHILVSLTDLFQCEDSIEESFLLECTILNLLNDVLQLRFDQF